MENIKKNYQSLLNEINQRASLLVVSKNRSIEEIKYLYDLGHRDFGENKVQELEVKASKLQLVGLRWHFIGNIQTNKLKKLLSIKGLCCIHSVSSLKVLNELTKYKNSTQFFLQVNTSEEKEKSGFKDSELDEALNLCKASDIYPNGLMTIGKIRSDDFENDARSCFERLNLIKKRLNESSFHKNKIELSIGMSQDYAIALEHNTDWVRIGSKVFA